MLKVNEIFTSIQGEGPDVGMMATFVRLSGCNLNCDFCDSKYANNGMYVPVESVADTIRERGFTNVIITGGEPFLQFDKIVELVDMLDEYNFYIETNGTIVNIPTTLFKRVVVSPKEMSIVPYWKSKIITFKFVVDANNIEEVINIIQVHHLDDVYLMPKGIDIEEIMNNSMLIVEMIRKYKINAFLGQRLHILMGWK